MKRILIILLLITIAACSTGTQDELNEVDDSLPDEFAQNNVQDCPPCEPEVMTIEVCTKNSDEDKCNAGEIDIQVDNLVLKKVNARAQEEKLVYSITKQEYNLLQYAVMDFVPNCRDEPSNLLLESHDNAIYGAKAECSKTNSFEINKDDLYEGTDIISFFSGPDADYAIIDVVMRLFFIDGTNKTKELPDIIFSGGDGDEYRDIEEFRDFSFANTQGYEVNLDEDDIQHDLVFVFDIQASDGQLILFVNNNEVDISQESPVVIPKELLRVGENSIIFIGN